MKKIFILDYGMGNIRSLKNSLAKIGYEANLFSENNQIESNLLIIPGVGSFNTAMKLIKKKKIDVKIKKFLSNSSNNIVGICLGKQLLYTTGFENGKTSGFDLINGTVDIISKKKDEIKLPNVGWQKIKIKEKLGKFKFLFKFNNQKFYFVHSYVASPMNKNNSLATSEYKNIEFCSISTNHLNVIGVQFHPEKSGDVGLDFLKALISNLLL